MTARAGRAGRPGGAGPAHLTWWARVFVVTVLAGGWAAGCGAGAGGIGAVSCSFGGPQTSATPAPGSQLPSEIVDPYLKIQTALAQDRIDDVRANAGDVAKAATTLGAPAVRIDTAAVQLASATELPDAREKFGVLSDAVFAYADGMKLKLPDGVRKAYCPMVNKPWLQKGDTLANPYYGSEMLTCGEFR